LPPERRILNCLQRIDRRTPCGGLWNETPRAALLDWPNTFHDPCHTLVLCTFRFTRRPDNEDDDMSRGYPSMTALLGLLAIAGYQNRDKIAEMLRGGAQPNPAAPGQVPQSGAGAATPGNLGGILGGASIGEVVSGGLRKLMDAFKQQGHGEAADSWVASGPNKQIAPPQLERAIGPDVLQTLSQQTGLSREEILSRLSKSLPEAVDKYTPQGRIPSAADFS